jgi:hypothetical protein
MGKPLYAFVVVMFFPFQGDSHFWENVMQNDCHL